MIEIIVDNSYSQVVGLKTEQFRKLKTLLSYQINPEAAFYSGGWVKTKSLLDKQGYFPTGLLNKVRANVGIHNLSDKRVMPKVPATIKYLIDAPEPRNSQENAILATSLNIRGGVVMPTGSGKSRVIASIAAKNHKTLVVVPNVSIRDQLAEVLRGWGLTNVTVLNIDSPKLNKLTEFDCLIIDECHHVAAATYQKLNKTAWKGIYYRYFLSATYHRNQSNEQILFEGIAGDVIYELSYQDAVKEKSIVPIEGYYLEVPKQKCEGKTWAQVYSQLVVHNEPRNEIISVLALRLLKLGKSTLILIKEIKHGEIISEMTGIPFCNGQDKDSRAHLEDFNSGAIRGLIATTGIAGEGTDTKPCEYLILAGLGKAKSAFKQQCGRTVRTYPSKDSGKVIIFRDLSHRWTKAHFIAEARILEQDYEVSPLKIEI